MWCCYLGNFLGDLDLLLLVLALLLLASAGPHGAIVASITRCRQVGGLFRVPVHELLGHTVVVVLKQANNSSQHTTIVSYFYILVNVFQNNNQWLNLSTL